MFSVYDFEKKYLKLEIYREKYSIEKIFDSLKNEIQIKPLRVWSEYSIHGAILLGFIAQLFIHIADAI
jgi:transposase